MGEFSLEYHVGLQNLISVKTNPVTRWNIDVGQFSTTVDYVQCQHFIFSCSICVVIRGWLMVRGK